MEQEFFEAFNIKKVRECELRDECFLGFAHTCDKCDIYGQAYEVYPPITSDIVLGLIQILIDNGQKLKIFEASEMFKDHTRYIINAQNEIRHDIYGTGNTLNNAILSLCIRFPHLSDQVRALFNAK